MMRIGEVIRRYRKEKNMTQEEMANRLGVSAPAVNKWENAVSLPDITMLAPIARLLGITLETLLSFHEELAQEEINGFIHELEERLKSETYEESFRWAKEMLEQYPNCELLIWQTAMLLDVTRVVKKVDDGETYDDYILGCYTRVLQSKEPELKDRAADSLFSFYFRQEQYEKAEEYLTYFRQGSMEWKLKTAFLYSKTNRIWEAYQIYEQMLFSGCNTLKMVLGHLYMLAMAEGDAEKAHFLAEKESELAKLFEMGTYNELSGRLQMAIDCKDAKEAERLMEELLESIETLDNYRNSRLYEHMTFKELRPEFVEEVRQILKKKFQEEGYEN